MPLDEDTTNFIKWATKLGFPLEDLPNEDALKPIFKSRQRELYMGLVEKVQPCEEVKKIRNNILIKRMDKLQNQVVPTCTRNFLPKEMQRYLKIADLKRKKLEIETRTEDYKREYETLASSIKTKNMQTIKLEHSNKNTVAKANVLAIKHSALLKNLDKEKQNKERILVAMPVKLRPTNVNESNAFKLIHDALKELDLFYNVCLNNSNPHLVQEAKEDLWKKLRTTFGNIPNFLIFNTILKLKEEQLQNIIFLNRASLDSGAKKVVKANPLTAFSKEMLKSKIEITGIVAKFLAAKRGHETLKKRFSSAYQQFVDTVQCKVNLFNAELNDDVEEIISDYIVQYNTRSFKRGQSEFLANEIEKCKTNIENNSKLLEDHSILLGSIKQIYSEIDSSVNRIQYETLQLNQIKEKISYSKKILQHMICEAPSNQNKFASVKVNSGGDIFDMTDNVFSSTKVDFDGTMNSTLQRAGDLTFMPQIRNFLPPYAGEISIFMETPIEKCNCISKECAYYIQPNPLIIESQELTSTIQLAPGILFTSHGAIQDVQNISIWIEQLRDISFELITNMNFERVDQSDFKQSIKQQHEQISELLDKVDIVDINTNRTLKKVAKYYSFVLNNPLRHYIPQSQHFNKQSYSEYESEYIMYYRMATVGGSVK